MSQKGVYCSYRADKGFGMKLSRWAELRGVSYKAAWRAFRADEIPGAYQLDTGTIVVPDPQRMTLCRKCGEWQ